MILEHPAFGPGWNKIFNITGVVRDDPGRYSFVGFILSSAENDRGNTGEAPYLCRPKLGMIRGMI
jgi:hypothetical protein